jgi:hypothetical protein
MPQSGIQKTSKNFVLWQMNLPGMMLHLLDYCKKYLMTRIDGDNKTDLACIHVNFSYVFQSIKKLEKAKKFFCHKQ